MVGDRELSLHVHTSIWQQSGGGGVYEEGEVGGGEEANLKSFSELSAEEMRREGSLASRLTHVR